MGRAGGGGHSGGHSVSHHSSGGHSSSGHHIGGSSGGHRAGSGSHSSGGGFRPGGSMSGGFHTGGHRGPGMPPPRPPRRHIHFGYYGGYGGGYGYGLCRRSLVSVIFSILSLCIIVGCLLSLLTGTCSVQNTKNREKANTGVAWQNDCIVDELGWFDNISQTERDLQYFYTETGVQPYIVLNDYDASLTTDSEKDLYAEEWYENNIDNEGTLLYMYFAEEDTDNDVGYMTLVNGNQVSSVMDSEAIEIFWNYLDNQWYGDGSTDDVFVNTFTKTANTIMTKSTTGKDILKYVVIAIAIVIFAISILMIMKKKRQYEAEKAAETERILKTPLSGGTDDDLVDKYTK